MFLPVFSARRTALVALTAGLLIACTERAPLCPSALAQENSFVDAPSAGCIVVRHNSLLIVRDHTHKLSVPGGSVEAGENARCAAYRETWEETGLRVQPAELIRKFDNGFHLFHCVVKSESTEPSPRQAYEIEEAMWLEAAEFSRHQWRYAEQGLWLTQWLQDWKAAESAQP